MEIDVATRLDPVSAIVRASRGWMDYQRRQFDASIDESKKALGLNPNFTRAYNYLGMNYQKKDMPQEALQAFTEADRLSNSAPVTRGQLAGAYARVGRVDDAHKILSALLRPGAFPYRRRPPTSRRFTSGSAIRTAPWNGCRRPTTNGPSQWST